MCSGEPVQSQKKVVSQKSKVDTSFKVTDDVVMARLERLKKFLADGSMTTSEFFAHDRDRLWYFAMEGIKCLPASRHKFDPNVPPAQWEIVPETSVRALLTTIMQFFANHGIDMPKTVKNFGNASVLIKAVACIAGGSAACGAKR